MSDEQKDRIKVRKLLGLPIFKKIEERAGYPALYKAGLDIMHLSQALFSPKTSIPNIGLSQGPTNRDLPRYVMYETHRDKKDVFAISVFVYKDQTFRLDFYSSTFDININLHFLDYLTSLDPAGEKEFLSLKETLRIITLDCLNKL